MRQSDECCYDEEKNMNTVVLSVVSGEKTKSPFTPKIFGAGLCTGSASGKFVPLTGSRRFTVMKVSGNRRARVTTGTGRFHFNTTRR